MAVEGAARISGFARGTLQRHNTKFETNNPRKGTARLQFQFQQSCFCERFMYIPLIGLPILLQKNRWTEPENIYIAHRHMNVEPSFEVAEFLFLEYINPNFFAMQGG